MPTGSTRSPLRSFRSSNGSELGGAMPKPATVTSITVPTVWGNADAPRFESGSTATRESGPPRPARHGQRVRIEKGALAGFEGTLARDSTAWRVVISVNALQRSIAVQVDRDMISVVNTWPSLNREIAS